MKQQVSPTADSSRVQALPRRPFLGVLASALGAVAWPWPTPGNRSLAEPSSARLGRLLAASFSDSETARVLGRHYLAGDPSGRAGAQALAQRLISGGPATQADLKRLLATYRDEDRRNRAFVLVRGWILSRTEAQACALTTLL